MKFSLLAALLIGFIVTSASPIDSIRMEEKRGNKFIIHQVDPGETVYSLAKRYDVDPRDISKVNRIRNNDIKIGQFLEIPYGEYEIQGRSHIVKQGESLYGISRLYGVSVSDLRRWNRLRSNDLSVGQQLVIEGASNKGDTESEVISTSNVENTEVNEKPVGYDYFVQTGETLRSIAERFDTSTDSIKYWNDLTSEEVTIGQKLWFPYEIDADSLATITEVVDYETTSYGSKIRSSGEGGITEVFEEGLARKIETSVGTDKYLALHRNLRMGTVLEVKNLMNNKKIYVRIVGKLPNTGLNENVMVRLTPVAFERLGIVDDRALVEINYFED